MSRPASDPRVTPLELGRAAWPAAELAARYPARLRDPRKKLLGELAAGPCIGEVIVTRWRAELPALTAVGALAITLAVGPFGYELAPAEDQAWWLNFADSALFGFYSGPLLAQDELQVAEHPILASVREALDDADAVGLAPYTRDRAGSTPVLVQGAERRLAIDLAPGPGRPHGLYGNHFAGAPHDAIRAAVTVLTPPPRSNILAIAAPSPGHGLYARATVEDALATATVGFAAARVLAHAEQRRAIIHTGAWGTGAFGGDKVLMAAVQLIAARLAQVDGLVFHAIGAASIEAFRAAEIVAAEILPRDATNASPAAILDALVARGFRWGMSDGN
jgi:hypothetical protein